MTTTRPVAAVTGGSAGIGKAICEDLLARGCEVISLSRRPADITRTPSISSRTRHSTCRRLPPGLPLARSRTVRNARIGRR